MNNNLVLHNNSRIILSHERKSKAVMDIYPTNHLLTYVREGMLKVKNGNLSQCFIKGEFVLFKKYTPVTITKTWDKGDARFSSIVFTFQEDLIQEALKQLRITAKLSTYTATEDILGIASNPVLEQFIHSLQAFFDQGLAMDEDIATLKTLEALVGMVKAQPNLAQQLQSFSKNSKADLHQYMQFHYLENKDLETFAKASGRSLSAFKKDFKALYQMSPYKWLKEKRLEHARHLLLHTSKKASEIYLECGFEDLAHFSKSFKEYFNINPSSLKKAV